MGALRLKAPAPWTLVLEQRTMSAYGRMVNPPVRVSDQGNTDIGEFAAEE